MKKNDPLLIAAFLAVLAVVNVVLVATHKLPWAGGWDWTTFGKMVAAAITLALFSQLYRDNALFKAAEHIFLGTAVAYAFIMGWYQTWVNDIFASFLSGKTTPGAGFWSNLGQWFSTAAPNQQLGILSIIIPSILGLMMYTRLHPKYAWVSRTPFALLMGFGVGFSIPTIINNNLLKQLEPMMMDLVHDPATGALAIQWNLIVVFIGVMATLVYFFFSVEHRGAVKAVSRVGVWFLMVAFGASFGYTVMARLSLLIGRIEFLFRDWIPLVR